MLKHFREKVPKQANVGCEVMYGKTKEKKINQID